MTSVIVRHAAIGRGVRIRPRRPSRSIIATGRSRLVLERAASAAPLAADLMLEFAASTAPLRPHERGRAARARRQRRALATDLMLEFAASTAPRLPHECGRAGRGERDAVYAEQERTYSRRRAAQPARRGITERSA
jgi:hypothetical protein